MQRIQTAAAWCCNNVYRISFAVQQMPNRHVGERTLVKRKQWWRLYSSLTTKLVNTLHRIFAIPQGGSRDAIDVIDNHGK
jgi:hypothetical protein